MINALTGQVALLDVFYFADDLISLFSLPSSRQSRTVNQSTKKTQELPARQMVFASPPDEETSPKQNHNPIDDMDGD